MKHCPRCNTTKSLGEFRTRKNPSGERVPFSYCRDCCNKASRDSKKKTEEEEPTFEEMFNLRAKYNAWLGCVVETQKQLGNIF